MEIDYNLRRQVLWVWVNDDRRARSWGSSNSNVLKVRGWMGNKLVGSNLPGLCHFHPQLIATAQQAI